MKKIVLLSILFFACGVFSSSGVFAAVDIVTYMALNAGKWAIWQEVGSTSREGYVTANWSGMKVRTWYDDEGSGWTFDSAEILQITPTALLYIGMYDGADLWMLEPAMSLPRQMNLNQPVFYSGILRNQRTNATQRTTQVFMITKGGLTVTTSAGTFTNCIKSKTFSHEAGVSRESTSLMCPGRAEVKGWVSKIKDTVDPVQETQNSFSTEVIQFGDSSPPLP
jgi:hypothetical protein